MITIEINREPVELYKILKFEGLVGTGGEAKIVIDQGLVKVNGQVELRRRNKIKSGDVIEFNEVTYTVSLDPDS
jgi:ribosome-associated protein